MREIIRLVIPAAAKRRLVEWICHEAIGSVVRRVFGAGIPSRGLRIDTEAPGVSDRTRAEIFWGAYESTEVRYVRRYLHRDLDVVELGSSLGVVSCQIARHLERRCRLVCVEANPNLIPALERNLARNAPDRSTIVLHGAIDYDTTRNSAPLRLSSLTTSSRLASAASDHDTVSWVPTTTLRRVLATTALGPFALVADIEGAEAGILFHDAEALELCQQIVIELHSVEFDGSRLSPDDLAARIEHLGFRAGPAYGPVRVFERT